MAPSVSDHAVVQMGLRAPRVAIVIDGGATWIEWTRLGLYAASQCWGGAGFILVPHRDGVVAGEVLHMVMAYDPDFVVTLQPTIGQLRRLRPDATLPTLPEGLDEETATRFRAELLDHPASVTDDDRRAREAVAAACSPYRVKWLFRIEGVGLGVAVPV